MADDLTGLGLPFGVRRLDTRFAFRGSKVKNQLLTNLDREDQTREIESCVEPQHSRNSAKHFHSLKSDRRLAFLKPTIRATTAAAAIVMMPSARTNPRHTISQSPSEALGVDHVNENPSEKKAQDDASGETNQR